MKYSWSKVASTTLLGGTALVGCAGTGPSATYEDIERFRVPNNSSSQQTDRNTIIRSSHHEMQIRQEGASLRQKFPAIPLDMSEAMAAAHNTENWQSRDVFTAAVRSCQDLTSFVKYEQNQVSPNYGFIRNVTAKAGDYRQIAMQYKPQEIIAFTCD